MGFKKRKLKSRVGKEEVEAICNDLANAVEGLNTLVWESVEYMLVDPNMEPEELSVVMEDILQLESAKTGAIVSMNMLDKKRAKSFIKDMETDREELMRIIASQVGDLYGKD